MKNTEEMDISDDEVPVLIHYLHQKRGRNGLSDVTKKLESLFCASIKDENFDDQDIILFLFFYCRYELMKLADKNKEVRDDILEWRKEFSQFLIGERSSSPKIRLM